MELKKALASLAFNAFIAMLFGSLLQACAAMGPVLGQDSEKSGYNMAKELRGNVVYVTGTMSGLGFIVGERDKELFIVTANHVVRPMDPKPGQSIPKVAQVEFMHALGEKIEAQIIKPQGKYDLAILSVPLPENFKWKKKAIGNPEFELSDKVWTIDADRAWTVSSEPGSINKFDPVQITTSGLRVLLGYSGAPLISKSGIIGMLYDVDTQGKAQAYPMEVIKSQVEEWGKPWDLEKNYTSGWLWVLLIGVGAAAALALIVDGGGGGSDGGGDTGPIIITAPVP